MKTDLLFLFTGLFGFALGFTMGRSFPWKPLVLLLCMSISAVAALPPLPVPRPVPALSPKHASQPKSTPMLRTIAPASVPLTDPAPPMTVVVLLDWDFFGCKDTSPNCVLYDQTHVKVDQMAGTELTLYMADVVNAAEWSKIGWSSAGTMNRVFEWAQPLPSSQRRRARFFRTMATTPILLPSRMTTAPVVWWDKTMPGARAWSTPKK